MTSAESVFQITVQPSGRAFSANAGEAILAAAIRSGVGLPYGCKDGACGSCKCKKISGTVQHGAHQSKALSADEEAAGLVLTCCAQPLSDVVLESRQVTDESAYPIKKMPVRVASLEKKSHDVMQVRLQLPAADTFRYHAGQYIEFILRDGARRAYSMANAPHTQAEAPGVELHIRHMPGGKFTDHVFGAMKEKEILRVEGPFGSFFLHESDKPMVQQVIPSDRAQIHEAIIPLSSPAAWPAWKISTRPLVCPVSMAMKPATRAERELSRQNWRSGLADIGALRNMIAEMSPRLRTVRVTIAQPQLRCS